jgi:hypothetical protein
MRRRWFIWNHQTFPPWACTHSWDAPRKELVVIWYSNSRMNWINFTLTVNKNFDDICMSMIDDPGRIIIIPYYGMADNGWSWESPFAGHVENWESSQMSLSESQLLPPNPVDHWLYGSRPKVTLSLGKSCGTPQESLAPVLDIKWE